MQTKEIGDLSYDTLRFLLNLGDIAQSRRDNELKQASMQDFIILAKQCQSRSLCSNPVIKVFPKMKCEQFLL